MGASLADAIPAAVGVGAAVAEVNPKSLAFVVGKATATSEAQLAPGTTPVPIAAFAPFAAVGVASPTACPLLAGDRAPATLGAGAAGWRRTTPR